RRGADASVYVGGTFGCDEPVFGLSDVDLIVVAAHDPARPNGARPRIKGNWRRLSRLVPFLPLVVSEVYVYEGDELRAATSTTYHTYGLDGASGRARAGPARTPSAASTTDEGGLLVR